MLDQAERTHRRYSPSKMERLTLCPGSDRATFGLAEKDSEWSIEGTKAHAVLEAALENKVRDARTAHIEYSALCMELLDEKDEGPYKRFYSAIDSALDHVYSLLDNHPNAIMWIETFVDPPSDAAPGETGGYCDIAIYDPDTKTLWIIDYKHGQGIVKAVRGNPQPMQYAAGFLYGAKSPLMYKETWYDEAAKTLNVEPAERDVDRVVLTILQPRAISPDGEERSVELTPYEVYEYLSTMDDTIRKCKDEKAPLVPGQDQCRFCPLNGNGCPAQEAKALAAVSQTFQRVEDIDQNVVPDPYGLDGEHAERAALALPFLRQWANAVEKRLYALIQQGYRPQFHKIVEAEARRQWHGDPVEIAKRFMELTGCQYEEIMRPKLLTITEADELIVDAYKAKAPRGKKKAAAEDARQAMAFLTLKQSSGKMTLVTLDDPRPAVDRADTFAQIGAALTGEQT